MLKYLGKLQEEFPQLINFSLKEVKDESLGFVKCYELVEEIVKI